MTAQILMLVISLTLELNGLPNSIHARNLIIETIATESYLGTYNKQINGPARGIGQMEPFTYKDIQKNFIRYNKKLHPFMHGDLMDIEYAIIMTRIFYLRIKKPIPHTRWGRAKYYKRYYNTYLGKGSPRKYMKDCKRFIDTQYEYHKVEGLLDTYYRLRKQKKERK